MCLAVLQFVLFVGGCVGRCYSLSCSLGMCLVVLQFVLFIRDVFSVVIVCPVHWGCVWRCYSLSCSLGMCLAVLQMLLFTHIRLAHSFSDCEKRVQCVQARLQAISILGTLPATTIQSSQMHIGLTADLSHL